VTYAVRTECPEGTRLPVNKGISFQGKSKKAKVKKPEIPVLDYILRLFHSNFELLKKWLE